MLMCSHQDLETIIASSNAVNRKMEEQISVGKGFDAISELWGQLTELMAQAGLPPTGEGAPEDALAEAPL